MNCKDCCKELYCPYLHHFNYDSDIPCIEFVKAGTTTMTTNTLDIRENQNMSKELDALKLMRIYKLYSKGSNTPQYIDLQKCFPEEWEIIEKALKELEERKEMMRRFNEACVPMILDNETEKKLKALDIIKKKRVNIDFLLDCTNLLEYNKSCLQFELDRACLNQGEFELLKEVML